MGTLNEIRKKFGITLLLTAEETYQVGLKAEWNNLMRTKFEIEPILISNAIELDSTIEEDLEKKFTAIAKDAKVKAELANITTESLQEIRFALNIPSVGIDITGNVDVNKVMSFSYEGVQARVINTAAGTPFIKAIKKVKSTDKRLWRRIEGKWFVEKLYYADKVSITVEKGFEANIKAKLEQAKIDFEVKASGSSKVNILIQGAPEVPFAAKLEVIRDYAK